MTMMNVQDAKAQFSSALRRVEHGEEITISRHGKPVARLVAVGQQRRRFGVMDLEIPDDFDEPMPEEELLLWE